MTIPRTLDELRLEIAKAVCARNNGGPDVDVWEQRWSAQKHYLNNAQVALDVIDKLGLVIVPKVATAEQGQAMYAAWDIFGEDPILGPEEAHAIYNAAIANSPFRVSPPTTEGER